MRHTRAIVLWQHAFMLKLTQRNAEHNDILFSNGKNVKLGYPTLRFLALALFPLPAPLPEEPHGA